MIESKLKSAIRDIPDFPKPGILFKDITPILKDASLCQEIVNAFAEKLKGDQIDIIAGIESRGFLFGLMLAAKLEVPFVPIRKQGKLPFNKIQEPCELEYGSAILELHEDAIFPGQRVLIHDDLLATGGTVNAATRLVQQLEGIVAGYAFVISLDFLKGKESLKMHSDKIISLVSY
ncbi:adenine phosphoribosyltransferase [Daejeonella oryzae]|uniref:adenine phosphoribosyltransferase n=1 Tax=Daejeonella oryzae TaxID=1122943 RepID=UPI000408FCA7|nr:adenine phosphoribosyltransferase [Daejeonella oryzae]